MSSNMLNSLKGLSKHLLTAEKMSKTYLRTECVGFSLKTFLEGDQVSDWHKLVCRMYALVDYYEVMVLRMKFIIGEIWICLFSQGGQTSGDI